MSVPDDKLAEQARRIAHTLMGTLQSMCAGTALRNLTRPDEGFKPLGDPTKFPEPVQIDHGELARETMRTEAAVLPIVAAQMLATLAFRGSTYVSLDTMFAPSCALDDAVLELADFALDRDENQRSINSRKALSQIAAIAPTCEAILFKVNNRN